MSESFDPNDFEMVVTSAQHLRVNKYFQIASVMLLLYDHAITFGEEVERVWTKRVTGVSILFVLNRYLAALLFFVDLVAYHDPRFTGEVCRRFVKFEGFAALVIVAICEMIMMLRVMAFCNRRLSIAGLLLTLWVAQVTIAAIGFSTGSAVHWPRPNIVGCVFVGNGPLFAALWLAGLITSTTIFVLTIYRSRDNMFPDRRTPLLRVFIRDGAMYFAVIFCANAVNTCVYFFAVPDLRALCAPFTVLITSTMVSRLVLNLRTAAVPKSTASHWNGQETIPYSFLDRTLDVFAGELEEVSYGLSNGLEAKG